MNQLEFDFIGIHNQESIRARPINEAAIELEENPIINIDDWHRTSKWGDWILDHIPYGWRIYYRYYDVQRWIISTYQRIRYGVADQECWSLDYTLTNYILPRLKHFKKMKRHTYPNDITPEEWEKILDEMIWAFEYMADEDKFIQFPDTGTDIFDVNSFNRKKTEKQQHDWDQYLSKSKQLQYRKNEALLLFAKYYEALWD